MPQHVVRQPAGLFAVAATGRRHEDPAVVEAAAVDVQRDRRGVGERVAQHVIVDGRNQPAGRADAGAVEGPGTTVAVPSPCRVTSYCVTIISPATTPSTHQSPP